MGEKKRASNPINDYKKKMEYLHQKIKTYETQITKYKDYFAKANIEEYQTKEAEQNKIITHLQEKEAKLQQLLQQQE
jgi:hypothetical protein